LFAYAYARGHVKKVLEAGSKMMPEFVYSKADASVQDIIVSNLDWVKRDSQSDSVFIPVSADIYEWANDSYRLKKTVPWAERFQQMKPLPPKAKPETKQQ